MKGRLSMGREHTKKQAGIPPKRVTDILDQDITATGDFVNTKEDESNNTQTIKIKIPEKTSVRKTFVADQEIAEALDKFFTDPITGKKKSGSKGFISKIFNNAMYKELHELGIISEDISGKLKSYDE